MRHYEDQFSYPEDLIRKLIPRVVHSVPDATDELAVWTSSKSDPALGGNAVVMTADVSTAIKSLLGEDRELVWDVGLHGEDWVYLSRTWRLPAGYLQAWYERVVVDIQDYLGGPG